MSIERADILLEWIANTDCILDTSDSDIAPNKVKEFIENNQQLFLLNPIVGDRLSLLANKLKSIALEKTDRDYAEEWIEMSQYVTLPEELNAYIRQKLQVADAASLLRANPFFRNLIVGDKSLHRDVLTNFALEKIVTAYKNANKDSISNLQLIQYVVIEICRIQALKNPEEMYRLFEQIPQSEFKDKAFECIANAFAQANNIKRALEIADCIENEVSKDSAFCAISKAQASTDIDKALDIAKRIENYCRKGDIIKYIVIEQASTDIDKAVRIAEQIEFAGYQYQAFAEIATIQALTNIDKALDIAERIQCPKVKNTTFSLLAITSNDLEKALEIADRISDSEQMLCLSQIAKKWALIDRAKVLEIPNRFQISNNLIIQHIAMAQVTISTERANETLNSIQDNSEKEFAIAAVAEELARINITEALAMTERISDINLRNKTVAQIGTIQPLEASKAIQVPLLTNPTEQFREINLIEDNLSKVSALFAFARAEQ